MSVTAGTRLGQYEILALLGAGGMGEVYRARDTRLDRDVAIKILPEALASDPDRLARFEREARAVAALSHPGILAIHDFGTDGGVTYAVTELLDGVTLRARLEAGPIPPRKAIDIGAQIARALGAAHDKGIVHRDIKPENVFITNDGRVKVLDFGLAKALGPAGTSATAGATVTRAQTDAGIVLGTVGYMSPEQVRALPVDHRSDLFSIGVVLYEMLTGRRPFGGDSAVETMNAILKEDPAPLDVDGVAPALRHIVDHCLEKEPAERFQSARDLAFALQQLSPASAASGATAAIDALPRRRRISLWTAAGLAALLAAMFLAGWMAAPRVAPTSLSFHRLTYRPGNILRARFSPDGKTVVYSAAWEGRPPAIYTVRTDGGDSRELGLSDASVAAVSSGGELAIVRMTSHAPGAIGTLARLPLGGGGAPRDVLQDVYAADWGPAADDLAIVRRAPNGFQRLESPVGRVLHESQNIQAPRISPDGRHIAFVSEGKLSVVERATGTVAFRSEWAITNNAGSVAWAPSGREIFVQAGPHPEELSLRAVDLSGRDRIVVPPAGGLVALHDVSAAGELLIERATARGGIAFRGAGDAAERDLSWLDGSTVRQLSHDGAWMIFSENLQGRSKLGDVFIRRTDGSPPIRLGDGNPLALSRDGKWVLSRTTQQPSRLVLLPTGPGIAKVLDTGAFEPNGGTFGPDGSVIFGSLAAQGRIQFHRLDVQTGVIGPVAVEGSGEGSAFVIDRSVATGLDGAFARVLPDGHVEIVRPDGTRTKVPGAALEAGDELEFLGDGYLYVARRSRLAAELSRIDLRTGARTPWRTLQPSDRAGLIAIGTIAIAADGQSYAYSYRRVTSSDLYIAAPRRQPPGSR
jgi:hypothetical protein